MLKQRQCAVCGYARYFAPTMTDREIDQILMNAGWAKLDADQYECDLCRERARREAYR